MSTLPRVSLRGGFSDRNGIKPENTDIQLKDLDRRTRVALLNATNMIIVSILQHRIAFHGESEAVLVNRMMGEVYCHPISWGHSFNLGELLGSIESTILKDDYDSVLTVIEYINNLEPTCHIRNQIYEDSIPSDIYNEVFEKEYVGYRFINNQIVAITDDTEVEEINEAVLIEHKEVKHHFEKGLGFLSDRESPDYENSIKESISAVERMCSIIIGKSTTLGDALKKLEESGFPIHPSLKAAFNKLYGYTSDGSGIRHSGKLGGPEATFEEAKFMLVSCCAFVNYLKGVWAKLP